MKKIVIIGAGGHAKVVVDIILKRKELLNENIEIVGFLDDDYENLKNKEIFNYKVLGDLSLIDNFKDKGFLYVIAIGHNKIREKIFNKNKNLNFYTAIHPTAIIGNKVRIESGTVVMANVVINSFSYIGRHCIINTGAIIEHDNKIADFVHISPGSILCGGVEVGSKSWIGARSVVLNNKYINENVVVGAGTVVIRDVMNGCTIVGNPGKVIKNTIK